MTTARSAAALLGLLAAAQAACAADAPALFAKPRSADARLAALRGGTEVASVAVATGSVADNRAVGNTSGANTIAGGAFAGTSGLPVVIQNSGNNVLIQNTTIVNVQVR